MPGPKDIASACQALESTLLKQLLSSSGAFSGSDAPGGSLHAQMFVETLADAVAKSGGLGLGRMIEQGLGAESGQEAPQGEQVVAGAELGRGGHTGRATGPHLPLELRRDGHPENPLPVIRALNAYERRADTQAGAKPNRGL
jgi:hypothetical protein